jgi:UDP-N-acetylglucosamine 1-carboxyvinyltransferase
MPEKFVIQGGKPLKGIVEVGGAKNAATPIIAATLLTDKECQINNLPLIEDVFRMLEILEQMGADISWPRSRTVKIKCKNINPFKIKPETVKKMRSSVLLIGPLLARFGEVKISQPGGDIIGARPIGIHLDAFRTLGAEISRDKDWYYFKAKRGLKPTKVILKEFSVTATENMLMASSLTPGKTKIDIAATEPHVQDLTRFLKKMGAKIKGGGSHELQVFGKEKLEGVSHSIIYDPVEAGNYIIAAAATRGKVLVKNVNPYYLELVLEKLKDFGLNLKIKEGQKGQVLVEPSKGNLKIDKVQALIYPGIPTDLQSAFGVLATQAEGSTLIHDPLYERRLKYLEELNKMGAEIIVADPHRAIINGPTPLYGREINSYDLRAGASLIIAGLIAQGKTVINDIYQIDRGYERMEEKLQKLGADIKRVRT